MKFKSAAIATTALIVVSSTGAVTNGSYDSSTKSVSNWESEAVANLGTSQEVLKNHKYLRCIKLNNYWCLKDVGWNGGIGHDNDRHTAFINGDMAARAAVRNFRTAYIRHGRKTAFQIMSVYAPPDDCIGSKAGTRPDGTCIWGKNPTEKYANAIAKGIVENSKTDLLLFDAKGIANEKNLVKFLQNMSSFELGGLMASASTIKRGICLENSSCQ